MLRWLVLLLLVAPLGCATLDPWGHRRDLETAQRNYTQMVRWGDFHRASQYVAPDERERFFEDAKHFADLRITDYEIGPLDIDDEGESATVRVSYQGYQVTTLLQREVAEVQDWSYEDGSWHVRPALAGLRDQLRGAAAR